MVENPALMVSVPQEDNRYFSFNLILEKGAINTTGISNQDTHKTQKVSVNKIPILRITGISN